MQLLSHRHPSCARKVPKLRLLPGSFPKGARLKELKEAEIQSLTQKRHLEWGWGKFCWVERPQPSSGHKRLKKEGVASPTWSSPVAVLK